MSNLFNISIPHLVGVREQYSGMDSKELCNDKTHFDSFPYAIDYQYNSRGFRDLDWPDSGLKDCIWCLGDSFTQGLGSPFSHTWPQVLGQLTGRRVINVSMNGASNNWLTKMAVHVLNEVQPKNMIIMWSYLWRRLGVAEKPLDERNPYYVRGAERIWQDFYNSVRAPAWPDAPPFERFVELPLNVRQQLAIHHPLDWLHISSDYSIATVSDDLQQRIHHARNIDFQDIVNFKQCVTAVTQHQKNTQVIHSTIPKYCHEDIRHISRAVIDHLNCTIPYFEELDLARDGHHFDIKTSSWLAEQIVPLLADS